MSFRSDETSSGVSSFASGRQRRARRWRPSWQVRQVFAQILQPLSIVRSDWKTFPIVQVTAPPPRVSRLLAEEAASHDEVFLQLGFVLSQIFRRLSTGGAQKTRVPTFSWSRKILSRFTGEPFLHLKIDIEFTPLGTRSIKQPTPSEEGAALVRWTTLLDTGSPLLADYPWCLFFNDDNMWLCSHRSYCKLSTCPGLVYTSGLSLGPLHRAAPILWSVFYFCQKTTSIASLGRRGHIILPADGTRLSQVEIW